MRTTFYILVVLILTGCSKENRWDCFKSYGDEVSERRELNAFHSVLVEGRIDVEYHFDSTYYAVVQFGDNVVEHIETKVENGRLKIGNNATCNWVRDLSKRPLIKIHAPQIEFWENRCSGDITFKDTLRAARFYYDQWESNGNAKLLLATDTAGISMHVGYCDVEVFGSTTLAELYSSAPGRLRAKNFFSDLTLCNNTSIQDIELYAEDYLYAEINGRGSILYNGSPEEIDSNLNGEGELKPL